MNTENVHFASGKAIKKYLSPNRSDFGAERGFAKNGHPLSDTHSVKTTQTAILKELNRNINGAGSGYLKERDSKAADSHFNGSDRHYPDSMEHDQSYAKYFLQKPKNGHRSQTVLKTQPEEPRGYPQVDVLEQLVGQKENLVMKLDSNEELIETRILELTSKKKAIRDEQNKLLKELEDLGLKLKDCEQSGSGFNFRNCTVLSPYLAKLSQQTLAKLKTICENLSNQETRGEIQRAIASIEQSKELAADLIGKLLSCDIENIKQTQASLQNDKKLRDDEREELVGSLEMYHEVVERLEQEIQEERNYELRFNQLMHKKNSAIQESIEASQHLTSVMRHKSAIEEDVNRLHFEISSKNSRKSALNRELSAFLEQYYDNFGSGLSHDKREASQLLPALNEEIEQLYEDLKKVEVNKHIDFDVSNPKSIQQMQDTYTSTIQVIGRVLCMIGRNNVETAINNFRHELASAATTADLEPFGKACLAVIESLERLFLKKFESQESKDSFDALQELLKCYVSSQLKMTTIFYDLYLHKSSLVEEVKKLIEEVQMKETQVLELNRKKSDLVINIPSLKSQNKNLSIQFSRLLIEQETKLAANPVEESRQHKLHGPEVLEQSLMNMSLDQSSLMESVELNCSENVEASQLSNDPARLIQIKQDKLQEALHSIGEINGRLAELNSTISSLEQRLDEASKEKDFVTEKIKTLRRGLIEALQKEAKEYQCISSLFDYLSKPVLSRDIGVTVLDSLLSDLSNLSAQINSEISRQKRIIKLVNKQEDYSHEGRPG